MTRKISLMFARDSTGRKTGSLAEVIAANFDSGFLVPLSDHYPASEWNAAMHQAIANRSRKKPSETP